MDIKEEEALGLGIRGTKFESWLCCVALGKSLPFSDIQLPLLECEGIRLDDH